MSLYISVKNKIKTTPLVDLIYKPLLRADDLICDTFGKPPKFVVTGTGRSGTVYMSWLLNQMGVAARHEYFYGPDGYHKRIGVEGEVSWLAVPFLSDFNGKTVLQVRHPIKTINSFYAVRAVDKSRTHNKYIRFINQHFDMGEDLLENAIRFYIEWNGRAEKNAGMVIKLEDLNDRTPDLLNYLGYPCPDDYVTRLAQSKKLNSKSKPLITYKDLPKGQLLDELAALSEKYGYQIDSA